MTSVSKLSSSIHHYDPDALERPATVLQLEIEQNDVEQPIHQHRKGQLVLALHGGVTCEVPGAMWMVPPHHAVWIPGGMPHSNRATGNARIYFLFIEPGAAQMPDECCTFLISPLMRELILYLSTQSPLYDLNGPIARVAEVLLEQLSGASIEQLSLPTSEHPKVRRLAQVLMADPSNRNTLAQWAQEFAMSERTLARLVRREAGLSFGRWRQQLHLIIALHQLAAGESVQRVAGNLGYDSVTAFITMFKKAMGQSPTQYFASLR